jgi:hypothetical protein
MPLGESGRFLLEIFDDEAVLFDRHAGDTHHLGAIALARLQGMTPAQIEARFAGARDALAATIEDVDRQLRDWGLMQ